MNHFLFPQRFFQHQPSEKHFDSLTGHSDQNRIRYFSWHKPFFSRWCSDGHPHKRISPPSSTFACLMPVAASWIGPYMSRTRGQVKPTTTTDQSAERVLQLISFYATAFMSATRPALRFGSAGTLTRSRLMNLEPRVLMWQNRCGWKSFVLTKQRPSNITRPPVVNNT